MTRARIVSMGIAVATVLSASSLATAADSYFDSVGGDDTLDGKTEATAKQTPKMPTGTGNTVYLKRGSSWTMNLTANNVTVKAYGSGDRPAFIGTISLTNSTVEGVAAKPPAGGTKAINGINVNGGSTLSDCEVDGGGRADFMINVGIGVMGTNNKILNNYIHDLNWSASGGQMDNSGGAEAIMVMGSNNEVAFNTGVNCQSANSTLGGFEGGCWEIVNGKAKSTISNVSFHHNYCEKSIGMWEASSGDFSAGGGNIQDPANHGIVENVTVSYNVAVDSMWMFLLQPVNTDFKNLVFANNTIIHTPNTMVWFDASHTSMGMDVHTYTNTAVGDGGTTFDTDTPYYKKGAGFQPGTVIVKNNIFVDNISPTRQYMMFSTSLTDHFNNIFVPAKAQVGSSFTLGATEQKIDLASLAFTSDYRLTSASTPAIDKGVVVDMTTNNSVATSAVDPTIFATTFNQDIDKHQVPCGAGVDIGASEYCEGAGGSSGMGGATAAKGTGGAVGTDGGVSTGGAKGTGGAVGAGGAKGTGGATSSGGAAGTVTGGPTSSGGVKGSGGVASTGGAQGAGGTSSSVGATTASAGGTPGAGGASSSGAATGTGGATGGQKSGTGCSCELGQGSSGGRGGYLAALLLGMLVVTARRRRSS